MAAEPAASPATVPLGRTGLEITELALGTAPMSTYFWDTPADRGIATAAAAIAAGIRLFDTAPLYGLGEAEERLGAALGAAGDPAVVVATKVGRTLVDGPDGRDAVFDFSAGAVARQLEASLARLGRDHVDIVHVHDPDDHLDEAIDGCLPVLLRWRDEGVVRAVSVGSNDADTVLTVLDRSDPDVVMVAGRLTLLDRRAAIDLVPACARRDVPLLAAGVFNSGVLARPVDDAWFDYGPVPAAVLDRVRRIEGHCRDAGVSLHAAALQFPLRFGPVAAVVVGMSSPAEVAANLAAMVTPIDGDLWATLDEID